MTSIIVLDSSSDEEEAPPQKKLHIARPTFPLTSTIVGATNATPTKPRNIPSSITVIQRSITATSKNATTATSSSPSQKRPKLSNNVNLNTKDTTNYCQKLINTIGNQLTTQAQASQLALRQLESMSQQQPPKLQPAPTLARKRKTPTPPPRIPGASPPLIPHGMMPMITSVESIAVADALPPLQLLATPTNSGTTSPNEHVLAQPLNVTQLRFPDANSLLRDRSSPSTSNNNTNINNINSNTTINNTNNNTTINNINSHTIINNTNSHTIINNTNNNSTITTNQINNSNYKPQLTPSKRVVTPAPMPIAISHTPSKPNTPTATITAIPSSMMAAAASTTMPSPLSSPSLKHSPLVSPNTDLAMTTVRRIKPTQVLRKNDEAWLQRLHQHNPVNLSDEINMAVPMSSSSSPKSQSSTRSNTPISRSKTNTPQPPPAAALSPQTKADSAVINLVDSPPKTSSTRSPKVSKVNGQLDSPGTTTTQKESPPAKADTPAENAATPTLQPDYEELIEASKKADPSTDMDKLIELKLLKYYHDVPPAFVKSRGFRKSIRSCIERIRNEPELVYFHLKFIIEELKVRRKSKAEALKDPEDPEAVTPSSTGNKKTDEQIKKLNKALYILTKRIEALEEAEVDWEDEDSTYLQVERFKKRACQIYEKICNLTGESKNALRAVKKPIQFNDSPYPQFNKTLQAFVNSTKEFPDYYEVLRVLEHCNTKYTLGLMNFEKKRIAEDAFIKVGKLLQSRRKTDLYETVSHFTANAKDPATSDPLLMAKLSENQKKQKKISDVLDKFAREQELGKRNSPQLDVANNAPRVNGEGAEAIDAQQPANEQQQEVAQRGAEENANNENADDDEEDEDDEDEEDDDDDEDENAKELNEDDVETIVNGHLTDDSETEEVTNECTTNDKEETQQKLTAVNEEKKPNDALVNYNNEHNKTTNTTTNTIDRQNNINEKVNERSVCDNKVVESNLKNIINNNIKDNNSNDIMMMRAKTIQETVASQQQMQQQVQQQMQQNHQVIEDMQKMMMATAKLQQQQQQQANAILSNGKLMKTQPPPLKPLTATMPALKIMSVSSINKSIDVIRSLAANYQTPNPLPTSAAVSGAPSPALAPNSPFTNSRLTFTTPTTARTTTPTATAPTTTIRKSPTTCPQTANANRQTTVNTPRKANRSNMTEIVISDEES